MDLELGLRNYGSVYPARSEDSEAIAAALVTAKMPATHSSGATVGIHLVRRRRAVAEPAANAAGEPEWNPGRNLYVERKQQSPGTRRKPRH